MSPPRVTIQTNYRSSADRLESPLIRGSGDATAASSSTSNGDKQDNNNPKKVLTIKFGPSGTPYPNFYVRLYGLMIRNLIRFLSNGMRRITGNGKTFSNNYTLRINLDFDLKMVLELRDQLLCMPNSTLIVCFLFLTRSNLIKRIKFHGWSWKRDGRVTPNLEKDINYYRVLMIFSDLSRNCSRVCDYKNNDYRCRSCNSCKFHENGISYDNSNDPVKSMNKYARLVGYSTQSSLKYINGGMITSFFRTDLRHLPVELKYLFSVFKKNIFSMDSKESVLVRRRRFQFFAKVKVGKSTLSHNYSRFLRNHDFVRSNNHYLSGNEYPLKCRIEADKLARRRFDWNRKRFFAKKCLITEYTKNLILRAPLSLLQRTLRNEIIWFSHELLLKGLNHIKEGFHQLRCLRFSRKTLLYILSSYPSSLTNSFLKRNLRAPLITSI